VELGRWIQAVGIGKIVDPQKASVARNCKNHGPGFRPISSIERSR